MTEERRTKTNPIINIGLVLFILIQFQYISLGQEPRIDSLRNELHITKSSLQISLKDSSYVNILNALAIEVRFKKRDSLRKFSEEALQYSKRIGYTKGKIKACLNLAHYHSDAGRQEKGAALVSKALKNARAHKFYDLELTAISDLAILNIYLGKNELAFKQMLEGIDIATKYNNQTYLARFHRNIGSQYLLLREYHEGLNYLKKAKKFAQRDGDEMILATINSNLASAYNHIDKPKTGIQVIDEAIITFDTNNEPDWLAFAYTIKGSAYLQKKDYASALDWFKQSEKFYNTSVDDERSEVFLFKEMARTYLSLEKDSISQIYAKTAFDLAEIYKNKARQKDASELLYLLYKKKNNLTESFKYLEIFQQLSNTIAQDESKKSMLMFKTQMDYEQQKQDLIENNEKSLAERNSIIAAILILVVILTGFILMTLRNQKKQKKLNHKLKQSESELIEINETKNKLFSIISHDLREPISAFSKLIELFNQGELEKSEFIAFMPKIESDIKYISFSLNNLLSWGLTQMEGVITKPVLIDLADIITANTNLLSEIAANKSITILNTLEPQTMVWSDRDQVDVVIRNLISNALKFTPKNGSITITSIENKQNCEVSIQDTGVGMDQQAQNKIFSPNSNITTYGTDNEKGTGLGLSLCKELIENNKGTIWVNSILNQGTCFKFTLPTSRRDYDKVS